MKYFFGILTLSVIVIWLAVFSLPDSNLHIVTCDVGQGDAILIQRAQTQILVDGGPSNKILNCLGEFMPFWDRQIEMVILTHPQLDHFGGLIEVFKRYKIDNFFSPSVETSSQEYKVLKDLVRGSGTNAKFATRGMEVRSGLIYLEIVNPSVGFQSKDLNDYSIVFNLKYGKFDALLTGDIGPKIIDQIVATEKIHDVEYLKVPHHGSKNGLTRNLLDITSPEVAVISVGSKNRYGHPHEEVIKLLSLPAQAGDQAIKILRTDEMGDVEVVSDGVSWWVE